MSEHVRARGFRVKVERSTGAGYQVVLFTDRYPEKGMAVLGDRGQREGKREWHRRTRWGAKRKRRRVERRMHRQLHRFHRRYPDAAVALAPYRYEMIYLDDPEPLT